MKKFALVDQTKGDGFCEIFFSKDTALNAAEYGWDHLSEFDRNRRTEYLVLEFEENEEDEYDVYSGFSRYVKIFKKST